MSQVFHIAKNKKNLEARFEIIKLIREFFWSQDFIEVDPPALVKCPGQEPNLSAMRVKFHNEQNQEYTGYLHTSPEYAMKKMLSAGFDKIFYLGKCYRDSESFGGMHNPEFTMIEWYRCNADFYSLMNDVEEFFNFLFSKLEKNLKFEKISMCDLWRDVVGVDLDEYLSSEKMFELCVARGFKPEKDESYEELFYRIFLNEIEPKLAGMGNLIIHHYPAQMASLSKLSEKEIGYAERFEVYINGIEIANAFTELTDADEQLKRLQDEQLERKELGKEVYEIDQEFIEALQTMPESAGIALGVDRLIQVLLGCQKIEDVIILPSAELFSE
ncbi:EF-P lysine aminoacylase GenX [Patescibacteria group bacterium]|nr:EF-P lysine aminoacylase GenX [Patescibacteria group bacterium]